MLGMEIKTQFKIGDIVYFIAGNEIKPCVIFEIIVREYTSPMVIRFDDTKIFYNVRDIHEQDKTYIIEESQTAMNKEYLQEILDKGE